jgi:hypothetical protein
MNPADDIAQAKRNAAVARARIDSDLGALQQRLNPKALAQETWSGVLEKTDTLTDQAVATARRRPGLAAGAAAATLLLVFRKPIAKGVKRLFRRKKKSDDGPARAAGNGRAAKGAPQPDSTPPDDLIPHIPADAAANNRTGAHHGH